MRLGDSLTESYCCDTLLMPLQRPIRSPAAPIELIDLEPSESAGGRPSLHKIKLLNLQRSLLIPAFAIYSKALLYMELWQLKKGRCQNWLSVTRKELALSCLLPHSLFVKAGHREKKADCSGSCTPQLLARLPHFMLAIDSIGVSRL